MGNPIKLLYTLTILVINERVGYAQEPSIVLEYKPMRPSYHPSPGDYIAQIVPPGKPWPASAAEYSEFSVTSQRPNNIPSQRPQQSTTINLVERFPELTTIKNKVTNGKPVSAQTVLEYKPTRPSFHPNPGNHITQIVPPGKPWPASEEEYATFSQTRPPKQPTKKPSKLPSKKPTTVLIDERLPEITTQNEISSPRPESSIPQNNRPFSTATSKPVEAQTVLEYKPTRPSFHPNPSGSNIAQIIPPGKPWPASPEEYPNFSVTTPPPGISSTRPQQISSVNLADRLPEITTEKNKPTYGTTVPPSVVLEYKPMRPFFAPISGGVQQIVPPGKPWPASPEEYADLSVTKRPRSGESGAEIAITSDDQPVFQLKETEPIAKPDSHDKTPVTLKQNQRTSRNRIIRSAAIPVPLQIYFPSEDGSKLVLPNKRFGTTSPAPLFTSGTQKSTVPDIIDILKEVHNITIPNNSGRPLANASNLLPFDTNQKGHPLDEAHDSSHGHRQRPNQRPIQQPNQRPIQQPNIPQQRYPVANNPRPNYPHGPQPNDAQFGNIHTTPSTRPPPVVLLPQTSKPTAPTFVQDSSIPFYHPNSPSRHFPNPKYVREG